MVIIAKDVLNIDTISKGNDKPWERIIKYMEEQCPAGELIEFDFRGIEVISPYVSNSFIKLVANPNFGMIMHNCEQTVNSIKLMCVMNNISSDNIKNIVVEPVKIMSKEEKAIINIANQLQDYFVISEDGCSATLEVHKRFEQVGQASTVKYIQAAIEQFVKSKDIKQILIDAGKMSIMPNIIEVMSSMVVEFKKSGINVSIKSNYKDVQDKIDLGLGVSGTNYSSSERYQIMKNRLGPNRVGILTKYKEGKGTDNFGRQGHGVIQMTRIAIFKGFVGKDGKPAVKFRSFSNNTFYTKDHWYLEHDCEQLEKLMYDDVVIGVDEIGIYDDFIGTKYHFSTAVQYSNEGTTNMYGTSESGSVVSQSMTIPERAKAVLDDFGIDYDAESLESYIKETNRILGII